MLRPYFDQVNATQHTGYPGMLVAQLRHDVASGNYWMEPAWLDHDIARRIEERGKEIKLPCGHIDASGCDVNCSQPPGQAPNLTTPVRRVPRNARP
jgi:hypothetical protein